jgi:flagellar basal body rod protein FlgC
LNICYVKCNSFKFALNIGFGFACFEPIRRVENKRAKYYFSKKFLMWDTLMSISQTSGQPSLMQALSISATGIQSATVKLNNASNNIANANTPGFVPGEAVTTTISTGGVRSSIVPGEPTPEAEEVGTSSVDLASEMVDALSARLEARANAKMMKILDDTSQSIIDIAG